MVGGDPESERLRADIFCSGSMVKGLGRLVGRATGTQPLAVSTMGTILDLPAELVLHILDLANDADLVHLLFSCRTLAAHLTDPSESLWRARCAPYNLFDLSGFPLHVQSFRAVYTGLLHPYGHLIGLWANDAPFTGKILEFRLIHARGAILGECWELAKSLIPIDDDGEPRPPSYSIRFSIGFQDCRGYPIGPPAVPFCIINNSPDHPCTMRINAVVPPTHTVRDLIQGRTYKHVPFPCAPDDDWVNRSPNTISSSVAPPGHFHGLIIDCDTPQCRIRHGGLYRFTIEQRIPTNPYPVYYPIRPILPLPSLALPTSLDWTPRVIDGIWLGEYGPHGAEVLFVLFDQASGYTSAVKLTGDVNVPRGVTSWRLNIRAGRLSSSRIEVQEWADNGSAVFTGEGRLALFGYVDYREDSPCQAAILSKDLIKIWWTELGMSSTFARYGGREPGSVASTA